VQVGEGETRSPAIYRRRLRAELLEARLAAGLTQENVAAEMDWSLSKINRIENGNVAISANDLKAVLRHYRISDPARVDEMLGLAKAARGRPRAGEAPWWARYRQYCSADFMKFIEFEVSASAIRNFEPQLVPGLLQTAAYARASLSRFTNQQVAGKLFELRMRRQEILRAPGAPQLFAVINEEVIRRGMGGPAIMREQIKALIEVGRLKNVTIELIPFSAGVHPAMHNPFVIDEFPEIADGPALYLESPLGEVTSNEKPGEVKYYREQFDELRRLALDADETANFLGMCLSDGFSAEQ
jgi:transcriptional regulator with XRE-family HTH domain